MTALLDQAPALIDVAEPDAPTRSGVPAEQRQRNGLGQFVDRVPGPGRKKGTQNKATREFKAALMDTFEGIGGTKALQTWAKKNPTEFYRIMARTFGGDPRGPQSPGVNLNLNVQINEIQYLEARQRVISSV